MSAGTVVGRIMEGEGEGGREGGIMDNIKPCAVAVILLGWVCPLKLDITN